MRPQRQVEIVIFFCIWIANAYFHQGGGWNQNARFDQVRAIVEAGRFNINDFLIYQPQRREDGTMRFLRQPVPADVSRDVEWPTANSGDIAVFNGRVYPNKPPGTTLLAVPVYWLIHSIERQSGIDPDDYWVLTVNLYLTTALTLAPLAAIGGIVFLRLSRRISPDVPLWVHVGATLVLGLCTLMWPFATMLFDHVPVAVLAMCCFSLLFRAASKSRLGDTVRERGPFLSNNPPTSNILLAGILAGSLVCFNYTAIMLLCIFAVFISRHGIRASFCFLAAALPPIIALALYHRACFGSMLATANTYQTTIFSDDANLWLGMFGLPNPLNALFLLVSPHYGLLATSPVLLLCWPGFLRMRADPTRRASATIIAAIFIALLLVNSSFNGWHGGYSFGPRYLIPAIPFLCLLLPRAMAARPRMAKRLAALSFGIMFLANTVNPLVPNNYIEPYTPYLLPLLAGREVRLHDASNVPPQFDATYEPPVSCNPRGIAEYGFPTPMFPPSSPESRWNAFNAGELLFPQSRWSLAPMMAALVLGAFALRRTVILC